MVTDIVSHYQSAALEAIVKRRGRRPLGVLRHGLTLQTDVHSLIAIKIRGFIRKQWKQITLLFFLAVILLFLNFRDGSSPPTFVYGNLTAGEVSEIKGAIHHDLGVRMFPKYSWTNIKILPGYLKLYLGQRIQAVSKKPDGTVEANVRYRGGGKGPHVELYRLQKGPKGWLVTGRQLLVD